MLSCIELFFPWYLQTSVLTSVVREKEEEETKESTKRTLRETSRQVQTKQGGKEAGSSSHQRRRASPEKQAGHSASECDENTNLTTAAMILCTNALNQSSAQGCDTSPPLMNSQLLCSQPGHMYSCNSTADHSTPPTLGVSSLSIAMAVDLNASPVKP